MFRAEPAHENAIQAETQDQPDVELVKIARTDPAAFSTLYQRYVDPIYRFCLVRLGDRQAAEDATSETFTKALSNLNSFRGGSFRAWLFRIAHNAVVDSVRKRRPSAPFDQAGNVADGERSPEELAVVQSEVDRLRLALDSLSEDQQIIIELGLAGWTGAEIAEATGKSAGNVRIIRYRAMQRLTDILNPPATESGEHPDDH